MQRLFSAVKIENFVGKKSDIFNIFAQNIDCGYTLEPPQPAPTINVLGQKSEKKIYTLHTPVKWGMRVYTFHAHVIPTL